MAQYLTPAWALLLALPCACALAQSGADPTRPPDAILAPVAVSAAAGTEPAVTTRVKMGATSNVHALVRADGKWLVASKEIKVTLGGCGG